MNFLRNPETKRDVLFVGFVGVIGVAMSFLLAGTRAAICAAAVFLVLVLFHFGSSYMRFKRIAKLSDEIDMILHGKEFLDIRDQNEGELSILCDEIHKMTIRLKEQADALKKDKKFLADSIADISHQIRTPLTSLNLMLSILGKPDISPERRAELVREMLRLLDRMEWLITSLLKMSRLDAGVVEFQRESISVRRLLDKAVQPLAVTAELKEIDISSDLPENASFTGDLLWSAEALGNILKNCVEHTPRGGRIVIEAVENALYTQIKVSDTGSGIAPKDLPHLFERFYRGENSGGQSFGIGLALARMIIMEQNGTIKAENGLKIGAVFTVRFYKSIV